MFQLSIPWWSIHNGKVYDEVLKKEKITHNELDSALRQAGCNSISEVHFAILESNGTISVKKKN
ncbi:MAG: DUF421 domain-containing protein [Proteobacteria bacterium]|nr:DUF421 domain-containing protein [Pseudomonadota bacterium]